MRGLSIRLIVCLFVVHCIGVSPAAAVALRVVITWDTEYPLFVSAVRHHAPPQMDSRSYTITSAGCPEGDGRDDLIPNSSLTPSPQPGYGPVEFNLDPVPADMDIDFVVQVGYCAADNFDWHYNRLPTPPTNVTVRAYEDGALIFTNTMLTEGDEWHLLETWVYRYKLDPWVEFDLKRYRTPSGFERIIANNYRTDIAQAAYPSPWQEPTDPGERPKFRVTGRIMTRRGALPLTPMYLRVLDPPDEADYVAFAGHAATNDNYDSLKRGILEADDGATAVDGAVLPVTTDSNGQFSVTLRGTSRYAGDNYVVEGSAEPGFGCVTQTGCGQSTAFTTWKRAYIELSSMFKRSAFIMARQDPTKRTLRVDRDSELCVGCTARLIHTPQNGGATSYYAEDAKITAIKRDAKSGQYVVTLDRVLTKEFLPAPAAQSVHLGDAIGIIDASVFPNGDYFFAANLNYLNQAYPSAYVEYIPLPNRIEPVPLIPHVPAMAAGLNVSDADVVNRWIDAFSGRWYQNSRSPNHQHVVGADRHADPGTFGYAVSTLGRGLTHVFIGKITGSFGLSAADWRLAGEVTVHEMAHNWHVNFDLGPYSVHCTGESIFNQRDLSCSHHAHLNSDFNGNSCTGVCPEYSDGIVGFHYNKLSRQSEYMYIRQRREPMPFDNTREP